ncbi:hypothetical protein OY671_009394, partial [Metschnikowia pulcherrima]
LGQFQASGDIRQRGSLDQVGAQARQVALVDFRVTLEQHRRDDEVEHGIPEEFQAPVVARTMAAMGQRSFKQCWIAEIHPDEEGLPDDIGFRHETPVSAVGAVIPIIAHGEVLPLGYFAAYPIAGILAVPEVGKLVLRAIFSRPPLIQQDIVTNFAQLLFSLRDIRDTVGVEIVAGALMRHQLTVHI